MRQETSPAGWRKAAMKINSTRFGQIEVDEDKLIEFPQGMIGFAGQKRYVLLEHAPGSPVHWLQSVDVPELAFPVVNPDRFVEGYVVQAPADLAEILGPFGAEDLWLGTVMTLSSSGAPTINLKAPVVMNSRTRRGVQFVLDEDLPVRFPLEKKP